MRKVIYIIIFLLNLAIANANVNDCAVSMNNRDYTAAITCINNEISKDRKNAALYIFRATINSAINNATSALDDYSTAIRLQPSNYYIYALRANIYMYQNKYDKALADLQITIENDSKKDMVFYTSIIIQRSGLYQAMNLNDKALKSYIESLKLLDSIGQKEWDKQEKNNPMNTNIKDGLYFDVNNGLCKCMIAKNHYTNAVQYCEKAYELDTKNVTIIINLASSYIESEKFQDAIRVLDKTNNETNFYIAYSYAVAYFNIYKTTKNKQDEEKFQEHLLIAEKLVKNKAMSDLLTNFRLKTDRFYKYEQKK